MDYAARYAEWVNSSVVSSADKVLLKKMTADERADAFFKDIEFGTAGMRGLLGPGTNRMNSWTVQKATVAFGMYLLEKFPDAKAMGVAISHDNRHQSREFTLESARILNEMGIKAYIFDSLRPTPELSYAVRYVKACGGIMITASHNPKEYNGYKVYDETGCQLTPDKIDRLLQIIADLPDYLDVQVPKAKFPGETITFDEAIDDDYVHAVEAIQINPDLKKQGFKIVYSPQHGTSYENAMRVFKECGYQVIPVMSQCTHDPNFGGTLSPNPENPDAYIESIKLAKANRANLIVMTDPDGDRVGVAYLSSKGTYKLFTGNQSAALLLDYILSQRSQQGTLPKNGVVYDTIVTSSLGKEIALSYGLKVESFLTGFKFIGDRIAHYEKDPHGPTFVFGYEESYGCLIAPFVRDKDGIQAILLYCEMALWHYLQKEPLDVAYDKLMQKYGYHDAVCNSVFFEGPEGAQNMAAIMTSLHDHPLRQIAGIPVDEVLDYEKQLDYKDGEATPIDLPKSEVVKFVLDDKSTVTVRPSGTEPKCKFYIESVASEKLGLKEKTENIYRSLLHDLKIKA
jgi:phosphoglucomutase